VSPIKEEVEEGTVESNHDPVEWVCGVAVYDWEHNFRIGNYCLKRAQVTICWDCSVKIECFNRCCFQYEELRGQIPLYGFGGTPYQVYAVPIYEETGDMIGFRAQ